LSAFLLRASRVLVFTLSACAVMLPFTARADTSGIISGTVTDFKTHVPLAGVAVVAKSPSATYRAVTDAHGRYTFLSVLPDNYSISFTRTGYAAYSAVAVVAERFAAKGRRRALDQPAHDRPHSRPFGRQRLPARYDDRHLYRHRRPNRDRAR
jgi:hypothetical protein